MRLPSSRRSPFETALAFLLVVATGLTAGGCLAKPPDRAAIFEQALPDVVLPGQWTARGAGAGVVADNWLATFRDEQLMAAVTEAILRNGDLRIAASRVEQAGLHAKLAGAALYPTVDLMGRVGGKMSGDNSGLQGWGLTVNWELDLWGRVRYGRAAAAADAAGVAADYEYARQSIAALVARSWFLATQAELRLVLGRQTVQGGDELVRLAETRAQIGVGNDEDVFAARATAASYRDAVRQVELGREQAVRALEILIGRYPAGVLIVSAQLPEQPGAVPAGLPSELLERRPDVMAAERRIAAAFNRVGEATAARLPKIALTTGLSAISSDLFVLVDRDNPVWNFGANLLLPLFRGGELKTRVEIRTAEQKEAVAAYAVIGLRSFGEVEQALAAELAAREREQILTGALADNQRALGIVQTRFQIGSTDLRSVTERQLIVNATSAALIAVQAEQRVQRVNLHLALGGSFEPKPDDSDSQAAPPAQPPQ